MRMRFGWQPDGCRREGILSTLPRGARVVLTHRGKTAIHMAGRALNLKPGDQVLVPAYNCGSEIDPLLCLGAEVVMYDVDPRMPVSPEELVPLLGPKIRAVYVTHYWGLVHPLAGLRALCNERRIALIEDAALSLFSRGPEGPVGSVGDVSVFSLVKSLPVPDGGALAINSKGLAVRSRLGRPPVREILRVGLPLVRPRGAHVDVVWRYLGHLRAGLRQLGCREESMDCDGNLPDMPASYYFRDELASAGMSSLTRWMLGCFDGHSIVERRRANYSTLAEAVGRLSGITPFLPELPAETCPLVFPFVVENRNEVCMELDQRGIAAIPWWAGYHRRLTWEKYPKARFLKDHVVALPVPQQIDGRGCAYMAEAVKDLRDSGKLRPVDQEGTGARLSFEGQHGGL